MDRIQHLQESVIDGRTENVRYRQNQLQALHEALRNNADLIRNAIAKDAKLQSSNAEVEVEYYLSMNAVKHFYDGLNFEASIKQEYLIANGVDNAERRTGYGLVILRPTTHTRLYSIVCPLAAALAAGNSVVLELPDTLLNVDVILKEILPTELDPDTFFTSAKPIQDSTILSSALLVDQTSVSSTVATNALSSQNQRRTIAIVDRTADIDATAKAIVTARFKFQGASPYSPDLIIVNEFVKDEFFAASSKYASQIFASNGTAKKAGNNAEAQTRKAFDEALAKGQLSKFGSADFVLADISDVTSAVTQIKVHGCYLAVITSTSMVDAIIKEMNSTLLAAYLFAEPSAAKFLAQHLNAHLTTVNQIPLHLLVGPAAPSNSKIDYKHRYNTEMFSIPRPQYIVSPTIELAVIEKLLVSDKASNWTMKVNQIQKLAMKELPRTGQAQGYAIGFFEQGILLGLGTVFSVVIPVTGWGLWVLARKVRSLM